MPEILKKIDSNYFRFMSPGGRKEVGGELAIVELERTVRSNSRDSTQFLKKKARCLTLVECNQNPNPPSSCRALNRNGSTCNAQIVRIGKSVEIISAFSIAEQFKAAFPEGPPLSLTCGKRLLKR